MVITADSARDLCEVAAAIEEAWTPNAKLQSSRAATLPPATPKPRPPKANRNVRPVEILETIRYGKPQE
jgi:hypothetical protein